MSKQELLLTHLNKGKTFTAKQIKSSFGIAHPASTIRNLREQGYCVYSNPAVVNGTEVIFERDVHAFVPVTKQATYEVD